MKESTLLKIALSASLIGIFIILIIVENIDVSDSNINAINKSLIDQDVKVKGEITRVIETPGLYLINIKDLTGEIMVVIFKEEEINLTNGDLIEVFGTVTEYKGEMEILAKEVIVF